ncbi:MAG TPA: ATP-binding protein [Acholeplasma sp.]|nr:ATP-binding protein [Acholeplasma sp.]
MKKYKKRILDEQLEFMLSASGAVLIEGPKWCGKTTTAKQQSSSYISMDDPKNIDRNLNFAKINPKILLQGETPRLVDEWQVAPTLWDAIRHEVDVRGKMGQFIMTGSVSPHDTKDIIHSGTGRISRLKMRTMSLYESLESDGSVSLEDLFNGKTIAPTFNNMDLKNVAFLISRGGWPLSIDLEERAALQQAKNYVNSIVEIELKEVAEVKSSHLVRMFLRSYSRNISTKASNQKILDDLSAHNESLSIPTINKYIDSFKHMHVIDELEAWNPNLRSKASIRSTPTRMFVDPSIAVASLGISPSDLLNDYKLLDLLFEAMAIRDLRVYSDSLSGNVFYYRDSNGLECDAIIHLPDGRWGAIEVKLGEHQQDQAAINLKKLVDVVDTNKMNKPSFLMVLTSENASYTREDGIHVVSIGSLKP